MFLNRYNHLLTDSLSLAIMGHIHNTFHTLLLLSGDFTMSYQINYSANYVQYISIVPANMVMILIPTARVKTFDAVCKELDDWGNAYNLSEQSVADLAASIDLEHLETEIRNEEPLVFVLPR